MNLSNPTWFVAVRAQRARKSAGFNLIELVIVMVIIGILARIAIPELIENRAMAYETTLQEDANKLKGAMERHMFKYNRYPSAVDTAGGSTSSTTMTFQKSPGVTIALSGVTPRGYVARFDHSALDDRYCQLTMQRGPGSRLECLDKTPPAS